MTKRSGEFLAPLPLMAVALMVVNDRFLKARFHSALTGKLSDIAVCFFMPLFVSELLGLAFGLAPRLRLAIGGAFTALLYTGLEVIPPVTAFALRWLACIGPYVGVVRRFRMTSDWTDLFCLALVPLALAYGLRRVAPRLRRAPLVRGSSK
ncbi:MAG TPA: hypothetical protein VK841_24795 [Polyangiaceae bacterium]|nr:hypothetical protein [Polyangiaceae bacterium]